MEFTDSIRIFRLRIDFDCIRVPLLLSKGSSVRLRGSKKPKANISKKVEIFERSLSPWEPRMERTQENRKGISVGHSQQGKLAALLALILLSHSEPSFAAPDAQAKDERASLDLVQGKDGPPNYHLNLRLEKEPKLAGPVTAVFQTMGKREPIFEVTIPASKQDHFHFHHKVPGAKIPPGRYVLSLHQGRLLEKGEDKKPLRNHLGALARRFFFTVGGQVKARVLAYYNEEHPKEGALRPSVFVVGTLKGLPYQSKVDLRFRYGSEGPYSPWQAALINEKEEIEARLDLAKQTASADFIQMEVSLDLKSQSPQIKDWLARNKGLEKAKRHPLEKITVILPVKRIGPFRSSFFRFRMGANWRSRLSFSGTECGFPQGTRLDMRFAREGNRQHIAWYRSIINQKGSYRGLSTKFSKELPPGLYKVDIWIKMRSQSKAMRLWFGENRGWTQNHRELLSSLPFRIGSKSAEVVFLAKARSQILIHLQELDDEFRSIRAFPLARSRQSAEESKKAAARIRGSLAQTQKSIYVWERKYLALPYEKERLELNSILGNEFKLLRMSERNPDSFEKAANALRERIKVLREKLQ